MIERDTLAHWRDGLHFLFLLLSQFIAKTTTLHPTRAPSKLQTRINLRRFASPSPAWRAGRTADTCGLKGGKRPKGFTGHGNRYG